MASLVENSVLNAGLNIIVNNCDELYFCSANPGVGSSGAEYTLADTTYLLAEDLTLAPGDYALSDGSTGRKLTLTGPSNPVIASTGSVTHVAFADAGTSTVHYVKQLDAPIAITQNNNLDYGNIVFELLDPTNE